jgi:hypothetical protein
VNGVAAATSDSGVRGDHAAFNVRPELVPRHPVLFSGVV